MASDDLDKLIDETPADSSPSPDGGPAPMGHGDDLDSLIASTPPADDQSHGHFDQELQDFKRAATPYVRALLNGATFRHAADIAGFLDPAHAADYQREYHNASVEHPLTELAGGFTAPLPGVGSLKAVGGVGGVLARTAARGLIGAGAGLATGDTNLSPAQRALYGAGAGVLGSAVAEGAGALAGKAADKVRAATADQAELVNKTAQKNLRAARSAVGGETAAVLKNHETLQQIAQNAGGIHPPEVVTAARARLVDPKYLELVRNAARNAVDAAGDRLSGSYESAQNILDTARKAATPEAIDSATEEALAHPIRTQVLPRLKTYASRAIPVAVGASVGGPAGAVVGGATAAALGHPGTALANMVKNPAMRAAAFRALQGAAGGTATAVERETPGFAEGAVTHATPQLGAMAPAVAGDGTTPEQEAQKPDNPTFKAMGKVGAVLQTEPARLGKFGVLLTNVAQQRGPDAAAAAHFVLMQSNPEYQAHAKALEDGTTP